MDFYTLITKDECFDLPKDMPIPKYGSIVFIDSKSFLIEYVHYNIQKGKLKGVTLLAKEV